MATDNATIMAKVWLSGTNDFQQRVPMPTQQNINDTVSFIFDPMNRQYFNQFLDILINRVGMVYVNNKTFSNPLSGFKRGRLYYGSTVEEVATNFIKAHAYEDDSESLLKMHRPEVAAAYYSQNRRDYYPITLNEQELRTAFTEEYGLNNLIASLMNVPTNSDEYDEMNIMINLISLYENNYGFYKVNLANPVTDEDSGKAFLTQARALAGRLKFPSADYNADMAKFGMPQVPTFITDTDELILIITPETKASLDVNTLAVLFNVDKADIDYRTILVPEMPIPGAVALLTTADFFACWDTNYEMTSFFNPQTLGTTYFLHHWGVYAASPFVPAILFTTDSGTVNTVAGFTASGLTITPDKTQASTGDKVALNIALTGTYAMTPEGKPQPKTIIVPPGTANIAITAEDKDNNPVTIGARTYVDSYGTLHIQNTNLPGGTQIHVSAKAYYKNPDGTTPTLQPATATITIN